MDAESSICLSDLVPALRWSRPQQVAEVLADPRLPAGWWASVGISRALGAAGIDWISERLARLCVSRWEHLPLSDLLPALQVHTVDPALPAWPEPARTIVTGLGGWSRLRRLTPGDLSSGEPEAVVAAVFHEVLSQIPAQQPAPGEGEQAGSAEQAQTGKGAEAAEAASPPAEKASPVLPLPRRETARPTHEVEVVHPSAQAGPPAAPTAPAPAPVPQQTVPAAEYPLVGLVDGLFRSFQALEQAVAIERLFAADPVSLRALAHRLGVERELLSIAQRTAEERVLQWLRSSESAPVTGHLFALNEWLGSAATEEQLIAADPAHPIEVPVLRTPLWRVLVALMHDRRFQDGWLVVGDLGSLRERTRALIANGPASRDDLAELLGRELGIRAHSAGAWLDSQPAEQGPAGPGSAPGQPPQPLPRRTPGANGHHRSGPSVPTPAGIDPTAALATLSALSGANGRSHMMRGQRPGAPSVPPPLTSSPASDPRRWQRIEVTSEHLRGEPVAVPENYAAQLGMRPGTLLSVTGPGDNAVVLVWRDRQPVFDSLQPVLMRLNARPGDQVYVTVDGYRLDAQLTS
ncbi:hypothetical protein SAMN05421505_101240 [Sinosporangium album]|uniref:Uncharacterized protein n=1 Tax=Sinosporangium album TaxID=504805 RepID=A0A1G7R650_9ACTN|nr:hypothetical protein [Sinosporangium album]SDG05450.1 hypothetical protein SAMN05421505_101240 [Sinosporangium album]